MAFPKRRFPENSWFANKGQRQGECGVRQVVKQVVCFYVECCVFRNVFSQEIRTFALSARQWPSGSLECADGRQAFGLFSRGCISLWREVFVNPNFIFMNLSTLITDLDFQQIASTFIVLFAVIDIFGATPIILDLKAKGRPVSPVKATLISTALLVGFFYVGDAMLRLFSVDIQSFAVAGAFVIFLMSLEMILDIEIFKNIGPIKEATLVPVVFPLLAGAGSFTTLLSLRAEYAAVNILLALLANMVIVFAVLKATEHVERVISKGGIYLMRKFFGIILLAISVRLFTSNIMPLISSFSTSAP